MIDNEEIIHLSDVRRSGEEIRWRQKKIESIKLAASLERLKIEQAKRVKYCGCALSYDKDIATLNKKLTKRNLHFCKHMLCPLCQSRKGIKNYYRLLEIIRRVEEEDGEKANLILITLTIKNVQKEAFSDTVQQLLNSWKKLTRISKFKQITAYYRSLEVTISDTLEYHPHLHILACVNNQYFKKENKDYIKTEELAKLWKRSLSVEYEPICDMRRIKNGKKGLLEVSKYLVKSSDIINNRTEEEIDSIVHTLVTGLRNRRLIGFGGRFKEINKKIKSEQKKVIQENKEFEELLCLSGNLHTHESLEQYVREEQYEWDWEKMDYIRKE